MVLYSFFGVRDCFDEEVGISMRCTFYNPYALLSENFAIDLVCLSSLLGHNVALKRLRIHTTHSAQPSISITVPERLADRLPFIESVLLDGIRFLLITYRRHIATLSLVQTLKDLLVASESQFSLTLILIC